MPLIKSASPKAMKQNIRTEVRAGKPVRQAVAIGEAVRRRAAEPKGGKSHLGAAKRFHVRHGY